MKTIIMFNAPKGAGKTTIAEAYKKLINPKAIICPVFTSVKLAALQHHDIDPKRLEEFEAIKDISNIELGGKTPRKIYDAFGTEYRARYGEDSIAKLWRKELAAALGQSDVILVPDLRFYPELEEAKKHVKHDGTVIIVHLKRDGCDWSKDLGRQVLAYPRLELSNNLTISSVLHPLTQLIKGVSA